MTVVVDASVALKWVLQEEGTEEALRLWDRWQETSELVSAPHIFRPEVTNGLYQGVRRGYFGTSETTDALDLLMSAVAMEEPDGLYGRAISLASQFQLGSTYDALYLALAETRECEFWTADRRFVRSLRGQFPQVRWIGEGLG